MHRLVKDRDEQLDDFRRTARLFLYSTHVHLLEENIEKLVNLGRRDQTSSHNLWDISPLDEDLAEAKVGHWSCFYVLANKQRWLDGWSRTRLEVVLPGDTKLIILFGIGLWDLPSIDRARSSGAPPFVLLQGEVGQHANGGSIHGQ